MLPWVASCAVMWSKPSSSLEDGSSTIRVMLQGLPKFQCLVPATCPFQVHSAFSWENWAVVVVEICFRLIRYCTCIFVGKSKRKKHPVAIHHNHMAWDCACCRSCFHTGIVGHDEVLSGLLQSAMCLPSLLNLAIAFCRILEHASRSPFEFPLHCGRASAHY